MEVHYIVLCFALFTTAACLSWGDTVPEYDNLALDAQGKNCNCENGRCFTDKEGHQKCACKPGYSLQDEFTCKPCDCGSLGKCIFVLKPTGEGDQFQYQKKCVCDRGCAEKDGVCVDCFCGENSACDFDFGERRCYCIEGYSEKDGKCTRCDCGFNGQCEYQSGIKKCTCDDGYLELNGMCTECDCGESGSCSFVNGQKSCQCQRGFTENNGKCEPCDCGEFGTCSIRGGEKSCTCQPGYNVNNGICQACDCGNQGTCQFQNGHKICNCPQGYIDNNGKCAACDCGPNSEYCSYKNGVKQCKCKCGYEDRDGICAECYCGPHSINCMFNNGQKKCSCLEGYVQKGETCQAGCSTRQPCQNGGYCKDGYCFCQKGTRGEFCQVIDECSTLCPNTKDVTCSYDIQSNRAYCRCVDGNLRYNPNTRQCRGTCQTNRDCVNGWCQNGACVCLPGTYGDRCEFVDCVTGAISCMDQIYLLYKTNDVLFVWWGRYRTLMKFVRENVVLNYVDDCQYGTRVKCNYRYDVLWCHNGYTIYVPTVQNRVLRYRRIDTRNGASIGTCRQNFVPRIRSEEQSSAPLNIEKKSEFKQVGEQHFVK